MIVFFRNVPGDTQKSELLKYIEPTVKGGLFKNKGVIKKIEIIALTDKDINLTEYHALVTIEPDAVAVRVIKKLHGQPFRGKRLTVREYAVRSWRNDKRLNVKVRELDPEIEEKRKNPTRRRNLEVTEDVVPEYTSRKSFHRFL